MSYLVCHFVLKVRICVKTIHIIGALLSSCHFVIFILMRCAHTAIDAYHIHTIHNQNIHVQASIQGVVDLFPKPKGHITRPIAKFI